MNEKELVKLISSKEEAIANNLLLSSKLREIKHKLEDFLDKNLVEDSLLALQYRKFELSRQPTLWSDEKGLYPINGQEWIALWIEFFKKLTAEKTIKSRLEDKDLWVESRIQGEEQHLLIGEKSNKEGQKVHLVFGETGEIRIDKKDQAPNEILKKIESVLTIKEGKNIKTTIEFFQKEE